jgi:PPM family protein phosphatase
MTLRMRYAATSDVGLVRTGNEDSGYAGPGLLVVADGMGGHAAGEVASAAAVRSVVQAAPADGDPGTAADITDQLTRAVALAGSRLRELVGARPELEGMGTTLTILLQAGDRVGIAQVGDSRGYLLREGVLEQVTHDQTFVQSLVDQGRISDEEARTHPQRSVLLQALDGRVDVEPVVVVRTPLAGDRYLLCSDGLPAVVSEPTIRDVLADGTPAEAADRLVDLALRGGAPDNVTCLVADIVEDPDDSGEPSDRPDDEDTPDSGRDAAQAGLLVGAVAEEGPGTGDNGPGADEAEDEAGDGESGTGQGSRRVGRWLLAPALVLVLVAVAAVVGYRWTQQQYYVGVHQGEVSVYRGVPQRLVGHRLSRVVEPTGVQASTLPSFAQSQLAGTIAAASLPEARRIVDRLRAQSVACTTYPEQPGCPPGLAVAPSAAPSASPHPSASTTPPPTAAASPG